MRHRWLWIDTGAGDPAWNMALDEALLSAAEQLACPVVRFYLWTVPAATFGYFQRIAEVEQWTALRPLIRRTTGGGLVPHDADWTYSVIVPPGHPWHRLRAPDSYRHLHSWLQNALSRCGISTVLAGAAEPRPPQCCFIGADPSDLIVNGRKIAGAAQRRARGGLLIQGSVQPVGLPVTRHAWRQSMIEVLSDQGSLVEEWILPETVQLAAQQLAAGKYSKREHNHRK